jgi:hypothetical protein
MTLEEKCAVLLSSDVCAVFDVVHQLVQPTRWGVRHPRYSSRMAAFVVICLWRLAIRTSICSIPQGSVLGTRLLAVYVSPIDNVIMEHQFQHHRFADDLQLVTCGADGGSAGLLVKHNRLR